MKVSVVIPAYNEEAYIEETLRAVLGQTHFDIEVIVVDNASTDRTAEKVRKFSQVKLVSELKKGTQHARERGRIEATGDIIASLDADCRPDPDWVAKGLTFFNDERVVVVSGPDNYYDASPGVRLLALWIQKAFYRSLNALLMTLKIGGVIIANNMFIRAKDLEAVNGYDTSITFYGDDTDTAQRLLSRGRIVFTNKLIMNTSARRFVRQGLIVTFSLYVYYFLAMTFRHRFANLYVRIKRFKISLKSPK